jgi:carboxylesterase
MSEADILPGAEPFSAPGGPHGVLVCHGFTGCPQSIRGLAQAFAAAGFAVELPLLPGHGRTVEAMIPTRWSDWSAHDDAAYRDLAARCERVVVAGLSMGGTLAAWLAIQHPEIAGVITINGAFDPPAGPFVEMVREMLAQGHDRMPGVGNDVAEPGQEELAYQESPLEPLLSLVEQGTAEVFGRLGEIRCPALVFSSRQDHVVPPTSADVFCARAGGPVERIDLDHSFHVATLDYDRGLIEQRAVEFAEKVTAS